MFGTTHQRGRIPFLAAIGCKQGKGSLLFSLFLLVVLSTAVVTISAEADPGSAAFPPSSAASRESRFWMAGGEMSALTLLRDPIRQEVLATQRAAGFNTLFVTVKQFDGRLWYYSARFPQLMATGIPANPLHRP